jgi:ABC-2 type transport system permease protein
MTKTLAIAVREYNAVIRSKAFVISIVLLPVMMFSSFLVQKLGQKVHDVNDRHFAVIDRTPGAELFGAIEEAVKGHNEQTIDPATKKQIISRYVLEKIEPAPAPDADGQRLELSERIRHGELLAMLEIGPDVMSAVVPDNQSDAPPSQSVIFRSNNPSAMEFRSLAATAINHAVWSRRLAAAGIAPADFAKYETPARITTRGLAHRTASGGVEYGVAEHDLVAFLVPFALVMLMFMVVLIGAVPLLQGIAEEKQNRIAEVLLSSVSPFRMMAGKVLGLVATSFTLILVYLIGAYFAVHQLHMSDQLPPRLMAFFVLFQLLAVLMYGSLYIAIGAACNDPNQMQSLLMPVNLLMALPLILMLAIIQSPTGPVARVMTYFPPSTPFVAVARLALPPGMSRLEITAAIILVLITTIALIWASGRIFRIGMLLQGKSPHLGQLLKWVIRG